MLAAILPADLASAESPFCQPAAGFVYDVYRVPIAGVRVSAPAAAGACGSSSTGYTDAQGRFAISVDVTASAPSATASKSGYVSATHTVSASPLAGAANDFTLLYDIQVFASPRWVRSGETVQVTVRTTAPPPTSESDLGCRWLKPPGLESVAGIGGVGSMTGVAKIAHFDHGDNAGSGDYAALLTDGTVVTRGANDHGQLGDGGAAGDFRAVAERVVGEGGIGILVGVADIAVAGNAVVARLNDGGVVAWGENSFGVLGNDAAGWRSFVPVRVKAPAEVGGSLTGVAEIANGGGLALARLSTGEVVQWGTLWGGPEVRTATPEFVLDGSGHLTNAVQIAAGSYHALARTVNGSLDRVMAWGYNREGQLGNGSLIGSERPVAVSDVAGSGVLRAVQISANGSHSLARLPEGRAVAWGANGRGQLGDGTTLNSATPRHVAGIGGGGTLWQVASIAAGSGSSHALMNDTTLVSWGNNQFGQLGYGDASTDFSTTPNRAVAPGGTGWMAGLVSAPGVYGVRAAPCTRPRSATRIHAAPGGPQSFTPGQTAPDGYTTWTATLQASWLEGDHMISVCALDASLWSQSTGRACAWGSPDGSPRQPTTTTKLQYGVDNTAPAMSSTSPRADRDTLSASGGVRITWYDSAAGVSGSGIDPATATMTVDGQAVPTSSSGSTITGQPGVLPAGMHTVVATIRDRVGNLGTYSWRFNVVAAVSDPGAATTASPVSQNFPAGSNTVVVPSVPIVVDDSSFTLSSAIRSGIGAGHLRVPVSALRAQFTFNGVLPSDPQPVGLPDRTLDRSFAVLAPSAKPMVGVLTGGRIDVGPVTVAVPSQYLATGGTVTLTLDSTHVGVTLDDDPTAAEVLCGATAGCEVIGTTECVLDSQVSSACAGTRPEVFLTAPGRTPMAVVGYRPPEADPGLTLSSSKSHPPNPNPTSPDGCNLTHATCLDLVDPAGGTLRTDWVAGAPQDPFSAPALFSAYGSHKVYGITGKSAGQVPSLNAITAWQQSDVQPGSAPCLDGSPAFAHTHLKEYANFIDGEHGVIGGDERVRTTAPLGTEVESDITVGFDRHVDPGDATTDWVYRIWGYAEVDAVRDPGNYGLLGSYDAQDGYAYETTVNADGTMSTGLAPAVGQMNRWQPLASVDTAHAEITGGVEFARTSTDYRLRVGVYFRFSYDNTACS